MTDTSRRLLAFGLDWLVIALYGGTLFALVALAAGIPEQSPGPWRAQGIGFLTMTLPVWLYFSLTEASPWQGTIGKRVLGLQVATVAGARPGLLLSARRNALKFLPWECGHLLAHQLMALPEGAYPPEWVYLPASGRLTRIMTFVSGTLTDIRLTGR